MTCTKTVIRYCKVKCVRNAALGEITALTRANFCHYSGAEQIREPFRLQWSRSTFWGAAKFG